MEKLSVIVPVLDEAEQLPRLLDDLERQRGVDLEVVVADGGSDDGSVRIARAAGVQVAESGPGRGAQMNAGVDRTTHSTLLFLHADSTFDDKRLFERSCQALTRAIDRRGDHRVAGHFRLRFRDRTDDLAFRYMEAKTALNRPNTTNGDQGLVLRRRFFAELGGFDESMPFLEDQEIAERIRDVGEWITLPGRIETSPRRFDRYGFGKTYLLMAIIMGMWDAGVDEFFELLPEAYRTQPADGLDMTPFLDAIRRVMEILGPAASTRGWLRVGRFIRQNAWQPFFFADVAAGLAPSQTPSLDFYDRRIEPLIDNAAADALVSALAFVVFEGVLDPAFRVAEPDIRGR